MKRGPSFIAEAASKREGFADACEAKGKAKTPISIRAAKPIPVHRERVLLPEATS